MKVFEVKHAKVPIIKIKYKESFSLDVSFGIILNETIHGLNVGQLIAADQETESVL